MPPTDAELTAHAELAEVWCRACDQPATGPAALCDVHRAEAIRQLGVCGYPRGTFADVTRCACGLTVAYDPDDESWFHTLAEAIL
jgi:hypothetical protein